MDQEKWTLADNFPQLFSKAPVDADYFLDDDGFIEKEDDVSEKISEIDFRIKETMKKSKRCKSRQSYHSTRSAHSVKSNHSNNSMILKSTAQSPCGGQSPMKMQQKISHFVKKRKKKSQLIFTNNHFERQKSPLRTIIKTEPEKLPYYKPNKVEQPMTVLFPGYRIRFNYKPKEIVRKDEAPGCPSVIHYIGGDIETRFVDGTRKITHMKNEFIYYTNGDIQHKFPDGASAYYFKENQTIEFIHPNKTKVIQFIDGRRETILPSGKKQITHHKLNYGLLPKS
ncbi:hypothetical protein TRFO_22298 [Tritrichomonas foetus]|uniref:Centromere protein J C-terminal domain-containing protein n=1 Tax=Tritrichomonas foetus TaxID=1144522 RepID=A0A1J4KI06_9EUKA|nr:hypothetical protein TRFO_22298 [Tritrichomonas foetus]|eukprot:OHT08965.1 hypothetical protein TRFO_22298 [Tritrichomonas foetus]